MTLMMKRMTSSATISRRFLWLTSSSSSSSNSSSSLWGCHRRRHRALFTATTSYSASFISRRSSSSSSLTGSEAARSIRSDGDGGRSLALLGLGGHQWTKMEPSYYPQVVSSALQHGFTTLEAGQDGGDAVLAEALEEILLLKYSNAGSDATQTPIPSSPIQILFRVGYHHRLVDSIDTDRSSNNDSGGGADVWVENLTKTVAVVHNVSGAAIQQRLQDSPLWKLQQNYPNNIQLVPLIHNPEVQLVGYANNDNNNKTLNFLDDACTTLQKLYENQQIGGYGIVSNGICLPVSHPLHLPLDLVIQTAQKYQQLRIVQLPLNLLETTGISVAQALKAAVPSLQVYAMRPLTCYPERGTGTGPPFVLADQLIPEDTTTIMGASSSSGTGSSNKQQPQLHWTNEMAGPPQVYENALKMAVSHFDAEELLQAKLAGEMLTAEQRETLDGCKLLQSLFHDIDHELSKVRSLAAHEEYLSKRVIPLIYDTFESYDDETAQVLEKFFGAYNYAVRYAIAKNTRSLLKNGEAIMSTVATSTGGDSTSTTGESSPVYDIPDDMRLQEFGLRFVLHQTPSIISKVIVGATLVEHVVEDAHIAIKFLSEREEVQQEEEAGNCRTEEESSRDGTKDTHTSR